jgi:hypothetical protein
MSIPGSMEPSYEVVARARKRTLDPGDILEVAIYITGFGPSEGGKLQFYFPIGLITPRTKDEAEGTIETNLGLAHDKQTEVKAPIGHHQESKLGVIGNGILLNSGFFTSILPVADYFIQAVGGEFDWNGKPPVRVTAKVDKDAPTGDHTIPFVLTYGSAATGLRTSGLDLEIHVRSFVERKLYTILGVAALVIGTAATVIALFR